MNDNFDELYLRICSKSGKHDEDQKLLKPLLHIMEDLGSKTFVNILRCFNNWYKTPPETYQMVEDIVVIVLHAYMLQDDIVDDSDSRRSRPTAHTVYGTALTINAAGYAYLIALEKANSLGNPQAFNIVLEILLTIHRGQGMEIYCKENADCPSDQQYFEENKRKVASVIILGANLLKLLSESKMDLTKLSYRLADYFQLRNDYICLWSEDYQRKKVNPYEDITEGKFSCPIGYAINNSSKGEEILRILYKSISWIKALIGKYGKQFTEILKKRTTDVELKKHCIKLIEECGGRSYTLAKIKEVYNTIFREIENLGGNPELAKMLETRMKLRE